MSLQIVPSPTQEKPVPAAPTATQKLERARARLRSVARNVRASEGRLLDYETADEMHRTLHTSLRELEELTLTVAVMERRAR